MLLVVDDAHWADEPSLRFLAYVARRVESLPVALLIAARPAEEGALAAIGEDPATTRIEPPALGLDGVGRLLREHGPVDDAFARACHDATGGNPFLLGELVRALRADGVPFTAAGAERVTEVTPPTVSRAVAATLARLGAEATALARAAAVLGDGIALDVAAELAGLPVERAAAAAGDLVRAGLLDDAAPMRFRHPILTAAVRAGLSTYDRAAAHARAADLLRARGAAPERVALQVLHAPPAGDADVVSELRVAADHASERGAPATAAALLARALAEPPEPALLGEVLFELGRAELATASAGCARPLGRSPSLQPTTRRSAVERWCCSPRRFPSGGNLEPGCSSSSPTHFRTSSSETGKSRCVSVPCWHWRATWTRRPRPRATRSARRCSSVTWSSAGCAPGRAPPRSPTSPPAQPARSTGCSRTAPPRSRSPG